MKKKLVNREDGLVVLSLFDGMSCGRLALIGSNIKIKKYMASEINKAAINQVQRKYPSTIQIGSVCDIYYDKKTKTLYKGCSREVIDSLANYEDKSEWTPNEIKKFRRKGYDITIDGFVYKWTLGEVVHEGTIDLILAGSPCTQFSRANGFHNPKEKYGLNGDESKLWYEFYRLLKSINPKFYLLENVKMNLESEELLNSYMGVKGIHINSNLTTFQNRERIYWTNIKFEVPINRNVSFQKYKITTIPRVEQLLTKRKYENDDTNLNLTKGEIQYIYNSNLWAYRELKKVYPTMNKEQFVEKIHEILMESIANDTPFRQRIWNNGNCDGKDFTCINITNAKNCYTISTKMDRSPNSGLIAWGDNWFRFLNRLEICKAQDVPYEYLHELSYNELCKVCGNGWTISIIESILSSLHNEFDFEPKVKEENIISLPTYRMLRIAA